MKSPSHNSKIGLHENLSSLKEEKYFAIDFSRPPGQSSNPSEPIITNCGECGGKVDASRPSPYAFSPEARRSRGERTGARVILSIYRLHIRLRLSLHVTYLCNKGVQ